MASRPPRLRTALLALLIASSLAPVRATAQDTDRSIGQDVDRGTGQDIGQGIGQDIRQGIGQDMPQGMALTVPRVAHLSPRSVPLPPPRPGETAAAEPIPPASRLPDQATGPRRDRVVRDICIGC